MLILLANLTSQNYVPEVQHLLGVVRQSWRNAWSPSDYPATPPTPPVPSSWQTLPAPSSRLDLMASKELTPIFSLASWQGLAEISTSAASLFASLLVVSSFSSAKQLSMQLLAVCFCCTPNNAQLTEVTYSWWNYVGCVHKPTTLPLWIQLLLQHAVLSCTISISISQGPISTWICEGAGMDFRFAAGCWYPPSASYKC